MYIVYILINLYIVYVYCICCTKMITSCSIRRVAFTANTKENLQVKLLTGSPVALDSTDLFVSITSRESQARTPMGVQQSGLVLTKTARTELLAVGMTLHVKTC